MVYPKGNERKEVKIMDCEQLAIGIVKQACDDYRSYKRQLTNIRILDDYSRIQCKRKIQEIIDFFNSEYGDLLCFGKAKFILEKMEKEFY